MDGIAYGHSHDAPRGAALRGGSRFCARATKPRENRWVIESVWPPEALEEPPEEPSRAGRELVKVLHKYASQAHHHFTRFDQVDQLVGAQRIRLPTRVSWRG